MFSKAKDKKPAEAKVKISAADAAPVPSNVAMNSSSSKRAAPMKSSVPSIISADVIMHGNINAGG